MLTSHLHAHLQIPHMLTQFLINFKAQIQGKTFERLFSVKPKHQQLHLDQVSDFPEV